MLSAFPALAADHWLRLSSPEFDLYTTSSEKQARETLQRFEQVREFFLQASPLRNLGDSPLRIFQFDSPDQFRPYQPKSFANAYFVATPASDYIVVGDSTNENFGPAIHEYMHLIIRHSGLKLPTWLNEGWSDVFSTLRPMGKGAAVGDLLPDRMKALTDEKWLDMNTLTSIDQKSSVYNEGSRVGIFYAESWALVHMLFLSPEYKDNFGKFVMAVHSGKSAAEAFETAWGRSPDMVFQDLRNYFDRKRLYGVVFETRTSKREETTTATALPEFDARLALADLLAAIGKPDQAKQEYARLEAEQPDRADLNQSIGNLALWTKDPDRARQYFAKAFDEGSADPKLCFDLAVLDREAKVPPAKIIPILQRAIGSKPDYTDARVQLGLVRIEARDFSGAIETLTSIPKITSRAAPSVYCGLAYARVEAGVLDKALDDAQTCRKYASTPADTDRADRILRLVRARSDPRAAVRPGETLRRVVGIARRLDCSAEGNRLQVVVGNKLAVFDMPAVDAVELPARPAATLAMKCGPLDAVRIGVEFAPPRSAMETSIGVVRRLEY